jgi:hypothetical protein
MGKADLRCLPFLRVTGGGDEMHPPFSVADALLTVNDTALSFVSSRVSLQIHFCESFSGDKTRMVLRIGGVRIRVIWVCRESNASSVYCLFIISHQHSRLTVTCNSKVVMK